MPSDLLHIAVSEIRYPFSLMQFKGVVNADNGDIVVLPRIQRFDIARNLTFLTETMMVGRYLADPVRYGFRSIAAIGGTKADYVDIDGMLVRRTYSPIAQSEAVKRYPRDKYFDRYVGRYLR